MDFIRGFLGRLILGQWSEVLEKVFDLVEGKDVDVYFDIKGVRFTMRGNAAKKELLIKFL